LDGILNVLKPVGMTSFDVISLVRRWAKTKRVGHTGTLDPDASGVLTVCIGKATKAVEVLTEKDKSYRTELCLGITTDTQDASGIVLQRKIPDCSDRQIYDAVRSFQGNSLQLPPMYSAIKIDGKKLYNLAREGITVQRELRPIILSVCDVITITRFEDRVTVLVDIICSKGTYIRTLCHDIGEKLECGGHMSFLLRTRTGEYSLTESFTLEKLDQLSKENMFHQAVLPIDSAFKKYPVILANDDLVFRLINGQNVPLEQLGSMNTHAIPDMLNDTDSIYYRVYHQDHFLGLGTRVIAHKDEPVLFRMVRQF